jgi:hypothetical protein
MMQMNSSFEIRHIQNIPASIEVLFVQKIGNTGVIFVYYKLLFFYFGHFVLKFEFSCTVCFFVGISRNFKIILRVSH